MEVAEAACAPLCFRMGALALRPLGTTGNMHTEACSGELPYGGELQFMSEQKLWNYRFVYSSTWAANL